MSKWQRSSGRCQVWSPSFAWGGRRQDNSSATGSLHENSHRDGPPGTKEGRQGVWKVQTPSRVRHGPVPRPDPFPKKSLLILRHTQNPFFSEHCSYSFKLQGHNVEVRLLSNLSLLTTHLLPIRWAKRRAGRWSWRTATSSSGWSHKSTVIQTVPVS